MSNNGPFGFLALGLVWLVGAAHLQMHLAKTGVYYGSHISPDGWSRVCRYYLPVKVIDVKQGLMTQCASRMKFNGEGHPMAPGATRL